jgi:hypothetical protein
MTPHIPLSTYLLHPSVLEKRLLRGVTIQPTTRQPLNVTAENVNLIIAQDQNVVNAGSLFLRRGPWTRMLLDAWVDPYVIEHHEDHRLEQDALIHFIQQCDEIFDHTALVDQHVMNAYHVGDKHMQWQEGDIAVHFAGCWVEDHCNENFEERWAMRTPVPGKCLNTPRVFP